MANAGPWKGIYARITRRRLNRGMDHAAMVRIGYGHTSLVPHVSAVPHDSDESGIGDGGSGI